MCSAGRPLLEMLALVCQPGCPLTFLTPKSKETKVLWVCFGFVCFSFTFTVMFTSLLTEQFG